MILKIEKSSYRYPEHLYLYSVFNSRKSRKGLLNFLTAKNILSYIKVIRSLSTKKIAVTSLRTAAPHGIASLSHGRRAGCRTWHVVKLHQIKPWVDDTRTTISIKRDTRDSPPRNVRETTAIDPMWPTTRGTLAALPSKRRTYMVPWTRPLTFAGLNLINAMRGKITSFYTCSGGTET